MFVDALKAQRDGGLLEELDDSLRDLVRRVRETNKAGALTLKIKLSPEAEGTQVMVGDEVKLALPELQRGRSMFFTTESGDLSRKHPSQMQVSDYDEDGEPKEGAPLPDNVRQISR